MKSSASPVNRPHGPVASYKEVRFSQPLVPIRRARSVASSNPLLDPAHQAARATKKTSTEYAAYMEQSRSLLESQRLTFERERTIFAQERKLWDTERAVLRSRIAELELAVNTTLGANFFQPDFTFKPPSLSFKKPSLSVGLWQPNGPADSQHHIWEGPIPGSRRPTRVFPDDSGRSNLYIPPTEANGFGFRSSLDAALSPQFFDRPAEASIPVPIERVDSRLDGITLKSTALPPDVVAKVMTPPTSLSPASSPPKTETDFSKQPTDRKLPLKIKLANIGPPDANLTRNAGHTPMAIIGTETETSTQSPSEIAEEEAPLAPVVTKQPVESGDSYFPTIDNDPALTGPLSLRNETEADSSFLSELDKKLLSEAKKALSGPSTDEETEDDNKAPEEPDPELRLKASTNFGTVFGQMKA